MIVDRQTHTVRVWTAENRRPTVWAGRKRVDLIRVARDRVPTALRTGANDYSEEVCMELHRAASAETVIEVEQTFDFHALDKFKACYEQANYQGIDALVLDFSKTLYMDSCALGMLLNVHAFAKNRNMTLRLRGANEQMQDIFRISKFDRLFIIE